MVSPEVRGNHDLEPTAESVKNFVLANRLWVLPNLTGCVDPRSSLLIPHFAGIDNANEFHPVHNPHAVRRPGGDAGYVMVVMAALPDLPVVDSLGIVKDWTEREGRRFTYHQDNLGHGLGCGHCVKATLGENESLYGVPSQKVEEMITLMKKMSEKGQTTYSPVLHKPHNERLILVVDSEDQTINVDEGMFRYDRAIDGKRLASLVYYLQLNGHSVTDKMIEGISDRQTNATLHLLAKGLSVFSVHLDGDSISVFEQSVVE